MQERYAFITNSVIIRNIEHVKLKDNYILYAQLLEVNCVNDA